MSTRTSLCETTSYQVENWQLKSLWILLFVILLESYEMLIAYLKKVSLKNLIDKKSILYILVLRNSRVSLFQKYSFLEITRK